MVKTVKDMLEEANAAVPKVSLEEAQALLTNENALMLDVRDGPEVEKSGKATGAHHVSRGMIEFRADENTPFHDPQLRKDRPIVLYCASGGRAALAGKVLKDMGYQRVYNVGGFKDWAEAGGPVDEPLDPGM
ncbi:MAG: rhodanese-like domain-containing protein [Rhizobiaceae bacterium]